MEGDRNKHIRRDGSLTAAGGILASQLLEINCHLISCANCPNHRPGTDNPGGKDCPAAEKLGLRNQVERLLGAYLLKIPATISNASRIHNHMRELLNTGSIPQS